MKRVFPAVRDPEREQTIGLLRLVLEREPGVVFAFGHGSFFEGLPYHDVDIALWVEPNSGFDLRRLHELATRLEERLNRPVDIQVLNEVGEAFTAAAVAGVLLWARDPEAALNFSELRQRMAWDMRDFQLRALRDLLDP